MSKLCGSILIAPDLYRSWRLWFCFLLYDGISVRRQVCVLLLVCYCLCVIVCVLLFVCCCLCVVVCVLLFVCHLCMQEWEGVARTH